MSPDDMLDITAPAMVQVQVRPDGQVLWVNVDGVCRFRACRIGALGIDAPRAAFDQQPAAADARRYDFIVRNPWRAIDLIRNTVDVDHPADWRDQLDRAIDRALDDV